MAKKKKIETTELVEKKPISEGLKLMLRLYIFSVVPTLLTFLLLGINSQTGELNINWLILRNLFLFETITFIIAGLDKYKHEYEKQKDPINTEGKSMGLVRF